jgi:regulator of protease activity HflC (stomatin/prohibitin superfamily)
MSNKNQGLVALCGVLGIFLVLTLLFCWATVPAGNVGIVTTFGAVSDDVLEPGLHFVPFWKKVHRMSVQTQEDKETADVPTKEGLSVVLECSLIYALKPSEAVKVYKGIGENYKEIVVIPQFRSALRGATVKYEAKDLYTAHRAEIEGDLEKNVRLLLQEHGIVCEKILLRSISLPAMVKTAIEKKLASEQEALQMQFVIQKEEKEADRKRVEAKGIADSQAIIQNTLSDAYLRYLWVESLKVAANHNGTIIYVPTGNDGMPFFKEVSPKGK